MVLRRAGRGSDGRVGRGCPTRGNGGGVGIGWWAHDLPISARLRLGIGRWARSESTIRRNVAELQARGLRVAMVVNGVNDAPALARVDVGLAIGAGTDVAIESAGVVLASDDPRAVLGVITFSRASYRNMIQNLAWATGYNLISVPLAAGVLAPVGIILPPGGSRDPDERVDHRRGAQCSAPEPGRFAASGTRLTVGAMWAGNSGLMRTPALASLPLALAGITTRAQVRMGADEQAKQVKAAASG
jgi:hypothetical protein